MSTMISFGLFGQVLFVDVSALSTIFTPLCPDSLRSVSKSPDIRNAFPT